MELDKDLRSVQETRTLLCQAEAAFQTLRTFRQEQLDAITEAISRAGSENAAMLGKMACEETGFGNARDKEAKNRFASEQDRKSVV